MSDINPELAQDVSQLLLAAQAGDKQAISKLFAAIYQDLRTIAQRARRQMQSDGSATSLVHEVYERMAKSTHPALQSRRHFFAVAARAMRQIVIDHARERNAEKRGGGAINVSLSQVEWMEQQVDDDASITQTLALDESLRELGRFDPKLEHLVELKYFAGLEIDEIAQLTDRSATSLKRDWRKARAFLHARLNTTKRHE